METLETLTFGDDRLEGTLHRHEDHLSFSLLDQLTGRTWGPVPLLRLRVHSRGEQRCDTFAAYRIDRVERVDDGLHVVVGRSDQHLAAGLWLRIRAGELTLTLCPTEVYERRRDYYLLFAVDLLPGLLTVGPEGRLLLPLGEGVLSTPQGKPAVQDRFLIYLEQSRWELCPVMPVCAVQDGAAGLVALATSGAADAECAVATDGHGSGSVGFNASLRRYYPDPVDFTPRVFCFAPLTAEDDLVVASAKRLRRHVVTDLGKAPLRERLAEDPGLAYMAESYAMKLFHGIENEGAICVNWDKSDPVSFKCCLTFAEAAAALKRIKAAGIEKVHTKSVGWNARGHDGLYPTRFPVEARVGGEAGLRELVRVGTDLGFQINVHDNFVMNVPHAPDWDADRVIHDIHGNPMVSGWWSGGVEYQTWGLALPEAYFETHFARMQDLGIQGTYYCDYMMRPPEVNYHPRHGGPRAASVAGQVRILEAAKAAFGSVATEFGALPVAVCCDYVTGAGHRARGRDFPVAALIDADVPLFQLAFRGLTLHECAGTPSWQQVLRAAAFGRHPRDEWSAREVPMPVLTDQRIAAQKAVYDLCLVRFGYLQFEEMTGWQRLSDTTEEITYGDGTTMVVDWQAETLFCNGDAVARPAALAD